MHGVLSPFRSFAETVFGASPPDGQIIGVFILLIMLAIAAPETIGDLVLLSRRARATGRVVRIDASDDGPSTPVIDFKDASGRAWSFDSQLPCTAVTSTIGAAVPIYYDPKNPKRAREEGRWPAKSYRWLVWYGVTAFFAALVFWPGLIDWSSVTIAGGRPSPGPATP